MNKKIYLASVKLFILHTLFLVVLASVYPLFVDYIFNVEKLFDVLLITTIFNILALIISFYFAVKIVKKERSELFENHHRLVLFFYVLNLAILVSLIFIFLIIFKGLAISIFLFGGLILLLYIYYYFLRLVYCISFFGKLRLTFIVLTVILLVGYSLFLFLPQNNYKKIYKQTEVKSNFSYFHELDLYNIVGKRDLQDKNSAEGLAELINMIATDEKILDEGEKLPYILPTEVELDLLSRISDYQYLNFSEEYLTREIRQTGATIVAPLNNLRSFSRGVVKLAEQKISEDRGEAIGMLDNLLLLGNQMLSAKNETLISKLVGESMLRAGLGELTTIYENDNFKIEATTEKIKELDDMRNGQRLLRTAVFHMNDEMVGSSKNTAIFFKHFASQKHNIGNDFDVELLKNNPSLIDGLITDYSTDLEKLVLSAMVLPIMLPFELNIGNDYIIYRETKKLAQEPGHEMLDYYFKTSFADFMKNRDESQEKAMLIATEEVFTSKNN